MSKFLTVFVLGALALGTSLSVAQVHQFAPPQRPQAQRPQAQRAQAQTQRPQLFSQTSIEKGWKLAAHQQQPMLVMFTSDNCKFCKKMLAETYGHPAIQQMLAANTQTVLAHKNDYEGLVKKLGIRGYPSSVLLSPKGDVLEFVEGFLPPKEFAQRVAPKLRPLTRNAQLSQQTAGR